MIKSNLISFLRYSCIHLTSLKLLVILNKKTSKSWHDLIELTDKLRYFVTLLTCICCPCAHQPINKCNCMCHFWYVSDCLFQEIHMFMCLYHKCHNCDTLHVKCYTPYHIGSLSLWLFQKLIFSKWQQKLDLYFILIYQYTHLMNTWRCVVLKTVIIYIYFKKLLDLHSFLF